MINKLYKLKAILIGHKLGFTKWKGCSSVFLVHNKIWLFVFNLKKIKLIGFEPILNVPKTFVMTKLYYSLFLAI